MKKRLILLAILVLGGALRFYLLAKIPVSLYSDEVAIGYNAYSILTTGRDEFGSRLPINFRSFNDYKPPLVIYLTAVSERLLGFTDLAVRFPAALSGLAAVFLIYLLTKELGFSEKTALIAAGLLAVNPWHIMFSRALFEVQVALTLIMSGTVCFFSGKKRPIFYAGAAVFWSLSLYTYHAARLFVPLLGVFSLWVDNFNIFKRKNWLIVSLLSGLALSMPLLLSLGHKETLVRPLGISIFNNLPGDNPYQKELEYYTDDGGGIISRLFHNRRLVTFRLILDGYLKHMAPVWLFLSHNEAQFRVNGSSLFYLWEAVTIPAGLTILSGRKKPKYFMLLLFWLLTAPLAAAFAFITPSVIRALFMVVPLTIFSAAGAEMLLGMTYKKSRIAFGILLVFLLYTVLGFAHNYFKHYPEESGIYWDSDYKELFTYIREAEKNYQKIVFFPEVGSRFAIPHIFLLYYLNYPPAEYLKEGGSRVCDFGHTGSYSFGKYEFRSSGCGGSAEVADRGNFPRNSLIVDRENSVFNAPIGMVRLIQQGKGGLLAIYDNKEMD